MFNIKNVSKRFGEEFALRNISMTIGKGLNFIIGSSGSGKTTLLKILSGMEQDFDGDVFYCEQNLKDLTEKDKSYFYHNIFGFVWQDFNLLEDRTVLENVMLPQHLGDSQNKKAAIRILQQLQISELAGQKVNTLSGGQKQRVAISRELMKNPQVLLADEPTSALDEKSSKAIMAILRTIAKSRTVIVITHDTSLIDENSKVYELDKGELTSTPTEISAKSASINSKKSHNLSAKSTCKLAANNIKSSIGRLTVTVLSILVAATLLLVTMSGAILSSSQSTFDDLFATYGQSILDLSVIDSFTGASGTDGKDSDKPNTDVSQDISGLYEKYLNDERVSHIVFIQAFNNIKITADGKDYQIKSSGNVPSVNELTAGVMPKTDKEVVVPNSFAKSMGLSDENTLGKTIEFHGSIYNWDSREPVELPVNTTAKIVGVVDSTVKYEADGQIMEYTLDDSFFFSKTALDEMLVQAKNENTVPDFTLRTKTPADLIAIKDELNSIGIVPLGQFELVEDMVRLNSQTSAQSGSAIIIIGILSVVVALCVALMTALSRKREYAIYKITGYANTHLSMLTAVETVINSCITSVLFLIVSPLLNIATSALWNVNILNIKLLLIGVLLTFAVSAFFGIVTALIAAATKATKALTTGDK